ncbi:MAG: hypothetical protein AAB288_06330 [Acidobacteriota bacterium]
MSFDERVYLRIDDEGAAFPFHVGNDQILRSPALWKRDFEIDDYAWLELPSHRFTALVIGEGVAERRHLRKP